MCTFLNYEYCIRKNTEGKRINIMAFAWTKDLETGNTLIDSEHKQLIAAVNKLLEACTSGKGRQELASAVDFLVDYTKTHFSHEESLQIKTKYPTYTAHKAFHISYLSQMAILASKIKAEGPTIAMLGEVNSKVSLLLNHIKREDVKLAAYIKSVS